MACNCSECRMCFSYFLIFIFFHFFSKFLPIFVTSIEILKFHTSYTPFLDGCNALCWSRIKMIVTGKKYNSEFLLPNRLYTPQLGLEADLVYPFLYFICIISRFFILFYIFSNCFPILITSIKIWKFLSIRSKIIYIGKKLWEWISSTNLFRA